MEEKPNILFIMTDQQRADALSFYGGSTLYTPNLDRLAADGIVFDRAYTSCPVCTPARASLQTGLYAFNHGMETNIYTPGCQIHELPDGNDLLARRLGAQGYACGYTGKWHLGFGHPKPEDSEEWNRHRGYVELYRLYENVGGGLPTALGYEGDDFPGHGDYGEHFPQYRRWLADKGRELKLDKRGGGCGIITSGAETSVEHFLGDRAINLIDNFMLRDSPWYLHLNFWGPHAPHFVAQEFLDMYRDWEPEPWPTFQETDSKRPRFHQVKQVDKPWSDFAEQIRFAWAHATAIDAEIGRILDHLQACGEYEETMIVFAADHGDALASHGGLTDKGFAMYDETLRVPLVIKPPAGWGISPRHESGLVSTPIDLYATFCELAGFSRTDAERDGCSLAPLLQNDEGAPRRTFTVSEFSGLWNVLCTQRMLRYGNLKYVFTAGDVDELYDLAADPYEQTNLIDDTSYHSSLKEVREMLYEHLRDRGDLTASALRKLGLE